MTSLISQPNSKLISKFNIPVGTILTYELVHTQNIIKIKLNIPLYPPKSKKGITDLSKIFKDFCFLIPWWHSNSTAVGNDSRLVR